MKYLSINELRIKPTNIRIDICCHLDPDVSSGERSRLGFLATLEMTVGFVYSYRIRYSLIIIFSLILCLLSLSPQTTA
jgi:hypothetical protein